MSTVAAAPALTQRTAIDQVLQLPELLELILRQLEVTTACKCGNPHGPHYQPVKQLFVLQRVNKLFKDTITTSIHLRQRMLLEYWGTRWYGLHFAAASLGGKLYRYVCKDSLCKDPSDQELFKIELPEDWLSKPLSTPNQASSRSESWRHMKCMPQPQKFELQLRLGQPELEIYHAHFAFDDGNETLGDLYDRLQAFRSKDPTEQILRFQGTLQAVAMTLVRKWRLGISIDDPAYDTVKEIKSSHEQLADCGRRDSLCAVCAMSPFIQCHPELREMWAAL